MACELGLGVVPWSPLRGGLLSGKYRRDAVHSQGGRGDTHAAALGKPELAIIDALVEIADAHATTAAAVALAWLRSRPGVSAPIIGIRRPDQLEANLAALDVGLSPAEIARLSELSTPPATFNAWVVGMTANAHQGGTTVNGVRSDANSATPRPGDEII